MKTVTSSGRATVTLVGDRDMRIEREFAAPRHLVFRAVTDPELVRRWWHARRGEVTHAEIDLRVGGFWRSVMIANDGTEVAFHGTILELVPNERLVQTELFEMPGVTEGDATVNTMQLVERDGRTTMTVDIQCPTPEIRDAILQSGMEAGMQEAYDLLEEAAISLA